MDLTKLDVSREMRGATEAMDGAIATFAQFTAVHPGTHYFDALAKMSKLKDEWDALRLVVGR